MGYIKFHISKFGCFLCVLSSFRYVAFGFSEFSEVFLGCVVCCVQHFWSSSWGVDINRTSWTHSRQTILVLFSSILVPNSSFFMSLLISSIRTLYSSTDSTPPCLMLSFTHIFLVSQYFVVVFALGLTLVSHV